MKEEEKIVHQDFLSSPKVVANYKFLDECGVFSHIEKLNRELKDCKNLLASAVDIFNKISVEEILDAAVWQISAQFLPTFITFLWKPHQNRNDVTIKSYKNYKLADINLPIATIAPFESFFRRFPKPVAYEIFEFQETHIDPVIMDSLNKLDPEILIPIMGPYGLYGVVLIGRKMLSRGYTLDELFFLEQLMSFLSQAVQNNLHYEHSVRDVKTGLYNHSYFFSRLSEEIARTKRVETVSSLLVMDVDKFKIFNDTYGHLAGDRVLECLALTIKQSLRTGDVPSRFGGEEFTILLTNTPRQTAWVVAERLRNSVAAMKVPWKPMLPQVTISLGLVSFNIHTNATPDEIISRADEALYQSKENGRNRTSVWGGGLLFRIQCKKDPGLATA
ncbi:MAG: sensor domain-containing diguanylate cyclase [Treponema sp.]|jgi:diguanylate cyclase (GGDEF)-like protein|nr:sensor domain-containing diguanylate cyclase [Treponema sp.]